MAAAAELADLRIGLDQARIPASFVAEMRNHPGFPEAMRKGATSIVTLHEHNRLLRRLISDRGRAVFGIYALYLHHQGLEAEGSGGGGLTTSRLAELCVESGICSRGRVKALLVLLRWAGYLVPAEGGGDLRRRPLAPTEPMRASYRVRWRQQLDAITPILPEAGMIIGALDRPEIFARFSIELGRILHAGFRLLDHCPLLTPVVERDNGFLLLLILALSGGPDEPMPPEGDRLVSIADLAQKARVSRSHALNVLRDAERQGLVRRDASRAVSPQGVSIACRPQLADSLAGFFSAAFAVMGTAALRTAERWPDMRSRAPVRADADADDLPLAEEKRRPGAGRGAGEGLTRPQ